MNEIDFLNWVRGTGLQIATIIFVAGVIIRILEIFLLGRKANLAEAKGSEMKSGLRTIITRSVPLKTTFQRSALTVVTGFFLHISLFVVIVFFAPHIFFFKDVTGLYWPALPTQIVDALTVIGIITLLVILIRRMNDKVLRFLTNGEDLLVWFVTFAPLITGYLAFHRTILSGPTMIGIHILSVELLMVVLPFTKLMHVFTVFLSRWYGGAISGYRGVQS